MPPSRYRYSKGFICYRLLDYKQMTKCMLWNAARESQKLANARQASNGLGEQGSAGSWLAGRVGHNGYGLWLMGLVIWCNVRGI